MGMPFIMKNALPPRLSQILEAEMRESRNRIN
jgi:hypothetical protein